MGIGAQCTDTFADSTVSAYNSTLSACFRDIPNRYPD